MLFVRRFWPCPSTCKIGSLQVDTCCCANPSAASFRAVLCRVLRGHRHHSQCIDLGHVLIPIPIQVTQPALVYTLVSLAQVQASHKTHTHIHMSFTHFKVHGISQQSWTGVGAREEWDCCTYCTQALLALADLELHGLPDRDARKIECE